jgi:hypothetical protein
MLAEKGWLDRYSLLKIAILCSLSLTNYGSICLSKEGNADSGYCTRKNWIPKVDGECIALIKKKKTYWLSR